MVLRTDGFSRIFNHRNAMALPYVEEPAHITDVAVEVHRNDRLCFFRYRLLDPSGVDTP